jgi:hypothetical protein
VSEQPKYWFNLKTREVEVGLRSSSLDRIGPFDTEAEARNAEELVKSRSEAWAKQESDED